MRDEKQDYMKSKVASYSMGICQSVRNLFGDKGLAKVIRDSAQTSAENKLKKLAKTNGSTAKALGKLLEHMLAGFDTQNVVQQETEESYLVNNPECGCLPPFITQAKRFGFTPEEARRYECMRCMLSYKQAAEDSGIRFAGKLTLNGCWMQFYNNQKPN